MRFYDYIVIIILTSYITKFYFAAGNQWLNTMSLPSHTRDSDLNFLNTRYVRFINSTADGSWENITMRLDTTEVRSHRFYVNIKPYWPSLLAGSSSIKNKSVLMFPLTQVGNTSYRAIKLHNPSASPLIVQLVMDWSYPQGARLYHSLPMKCVIDLIIVLQIIFI